MTQPVWVVVGDEATVFTVEDSQVIHIPADGQVAGSIACHTWFGEPEVSYGLGQAFWGRGIATRALALFLAEVPTRSLRRLLVPTAGAASPLRRSSRVSLATQPGT